MAEPFSLWDFRDGGVFSGLWHYENALSRKLDFFILNGKQNNNKKRGGAITVKPPVATKNNKY